MLNKEILGTLGWPKSKGKVKRIFKQMEQMGAEICR